MTEVISSKVSRRSIAVIAAAVAIEGYDLAIYALFAITLSHLFFPPGNPAIALLFTVGTLGVGYIMRPLGGIVLGLYADKAGRKAAIALTVLMMSISTGMIGLIPDYKHIGLAAPLLIVLARLVQGFSAGGATAGSIAYLVEAAPEGKRGLYASWQQASQIGAFLISAAIGAAITHIFTPEQIEGGAWRIPFLLALVFGPLGLYIKTKMPDPDKFKAARAQAQAEAKPVIKGQMRSILTGFGITCLWNISAFILLFYMPTYARANFDIPLGDAFVASTISAALLFVLCPFIGALSDRIGRKPIMLASAILLAVMIYPLFQALSVGRDLMTLIGVQCVLAVLIAGYTAPISAMLAELFPTHSRSTGLSIAYNLSVLIIGAFGPLIVTWLIGATKNPLAPAFYVAAGAVVSALTLLTVRDRTKDVL